MLSIFDGIHLPFYKNEKFSHGNHIWYDIEKFIYRYPKEAIKQGNLQAVYSYFYGLNL